MALHTISVCDIGCRKEALKNLHFKSIIKCLKEVDIYKWLELSYSVFPVDCCSVFRINHKPNDLLNGDIQS